MGKIEPSQGLDFAEKYLACILAAYATCTALHTIYMRNYDKTHVKSLVYIADITLYPKGYIEKYPEMQKGLLMSGNDNVNYELMVHPNIIVNGYDTPPLHQMYAEWDRQRNRDVIDRPTHLLLMSPSKVKDGEYISLMSGVNGDITYSRFLKRDGEEEETTWRDIEQLGPHEDSDWYLSMLNDTDDNKELAIKVPITVSAIAKEYGEKGAMDGTDRSMIESLLDEVFETVLKYMEKSSISPESPSLYRDGNQNDNVHETVEKMIRDAMGNGVDITSFDGGGMIRVGEGDNVDDMFKILTEIMEKSGMVGTGDTRSSSTEIDGMKEAFMSGGEEDD